MPQFINTLTKTRTNTKILVAIGLLTISGMFAAVMMRSSESPPKTTDKTAQQAPTDKAITVLNLKNTLATANQKLFELNRQYQIKTQKNRTQILQTLITEAKTRKTIMAKLMSLDPLTANQLAITADLFKQLPIEVQTLVEQTKEFEGTLSEQHTDIVDGDKLSSTPVVYVLRLDTKRQLPLFFTQKPQDLERGMRIKVRGIFLNNVGIALANYSILSKPPLFNSIFTAKPTQKKMTVVLVKFAEQTGIETAHPNAISILQSRFFEADPSIGISSLKHFFLITSYGKSLITGSVAGWIQLPETASYYHENYGECLTNQEFFQTVINAADPLVNWTNNDILSIVYFSPSENRCGSQAITIGDDEKIEFSSNEGTFRSGVVIFRDYLPEISVIIHEIGHVFGLEHAQGWDCPENVGAELLNPGASPCNVIPYGDDDDMMGANRETLLPTFMHFSAARKEQLGWLTSAQTQTISITGNYTLNALEQQNGAIRQFKISLGDIGFYSIEYRQALSALHQSGVIVRFVPQQLLSGGYAGRNYSLRPGIPWNPETALTSIDQLFTDPYRGIKIQLTAKTSTKATVRIAIEKCDNIDNTGEGIVDEGCDDDNDNLCDGFMTTIGTPKTCTAGGGDNDDEINPRDEGTTGDRGSIRCAVCEIPSTERCNGCDDDCDGAIDEDSTCPQCVDSDGGVNPNEGGAITVTFSSSSSITFTDYCVNDNTTVHEEFCVPIFPPPLDTLAGARGWPPPEISCESGQVCIDPDGPGGTTPAYCGTP